MAPESDSGAACHDAAPALRLGAYEGPLDLLLALAQAQRLDLAQISVASLATQFAAMLEAAIAARQVPLPRLAEWLVMAAWLTLLRSRLLLPALPAERAAAEREAEGLRRRLADRDRASRLADWLERRPQLGRQVFARGQAAPDTASLAGAPPLADTAELLRACLTLLVLPQRDRVYRPRPPELWRVSQALERMRQLLPTLPQQEGAPLAHFLPALTADRAGTALQRRAALASTLLAGLELGREGVVVLAQTEAFSAIQIRPASQAGAAPPT